MCGLSIVIPYLGDVEAFESTLLSVLENRPAACEILVVDWGRYEDPYHLGDVVRFVRCAPGASLAEMVNEGCRVARGDVIHFLQCGLRAEPGWTDAPLQRLSAAGMAWIAPLVLNSAGTRVESAGVIYGAGGRRREQRCSARISRSRAARLPILGPSLAAGFFRRSAFELLGGFEPLVGDRLADIDLALSARALGYAGGVEPTSRLRGGRAALRPGLPADYDAGAAERLYWRHRAADATRSQLGWHWLVVLGQLLAHPTPRHWLRELRGRWRAFRERPEWVRHQRHLQELKILKDHLERSATQPAVKAWRPAASRRAA